MSKYLYKNRGKAILSDDFEESGMVSWKVTVSQSQHSFSYPVEAQLRIQDCNKYVMLDFDCRNTKDVDKHIEKLNRLLGELISMRLALGDAKEALKPAKPY